MGSLSLVSLLATVGVAIAAGTVAWAGSTASALRVACPQRAFSVGFYPKGRASEHRPHVRLYTKRRLLAQVFAKRLSFGPSCKGAGQTKIAWGGGRSRITAKRITLRCSVRKRPELRGLPFVGAAGTYAGNRLVATLGHTRKVFLRAAIGAKGSTLRYSTRFCRRR